VDAAECRPQVAPIQNFLGLFMIINNSRRRF
jgi:hypothetical protein